MQGTLLKVTSRVIQIYISAAVQAPRNQSWIQIPPHCFTLAGVEEALRFIFSFRDEPGRPFPGGV